MPPTSDFVERWNAFLNFMRPKMLASGDMKVRVMQLRQHTDLRMQQIAVKRPQLSPLELSVVVSPDKAQPKLAVVANRVGLVSADEAKAPVEHSSRAAQVFTDAAIYLLVVPFPEFQKHLTEFREEWEKRKVESEREKAEKEKQAAAAPADEPLPRKVRELLGGVNELWSMPALTQKLLTMLNDPSTQAADVAKELSQDPALSTQVLRVVNSAAFALSKKISSIQLAVGMVGFKPLKRIVTIASMISKLGEEDPAIQFDLKAFWGHSLWVAHGASHLARALKQGEPDDFFGAGLLHDLGKLVEYQYLKPQMKLILASVKGGASFHEAERRVLGVNHAVIGEAVAARWGLPKDLCTAIQHHLDTPQQIDSRRPARVPAFIAGMCRMSRSADDADRWVQVWGVPRSQVDEAIAAAKEQSIASLRDIFMFA